MTRTFSPKPADVQHDWLVIDATNVVLGRLASHVAALLRGKHKPTFAPHMDMGDHVIILNADKVVLDRLQADPKDGLSPLRLPRWSERHQLRKPDGERTRFAPWKKPSVACCPRTLWVANRCRSSRSTPAESTLTRPSSPSPTLSTRSRSSARY